jgi:hypothetical protein
LKASRPVGVGDRSSLHGCPAPPAIVISFQKNDFAVQRDLAGV